MRPRGSSLVRRLGLDDIKRPYFLAPEPMESQVLRKKKLNQGNYSCQEIINHLTQRLGVGHEEPQACRFHRRKALSNVTQGVSGNTGTRTHVCNLPARAPSRAHGLGQWWPMGTWAGPVGKGDRHSFLHSLSGAFLLHQNISSVTAQITSILPCWISSA